MNLTVVNFDQRLGAAHSYRSSKSAFSYIFAPFASLWCKNYEKWGPNGFRYEMIFSAILLGTRQFLSHSKLKINRFLDTKWLFFKRILLTGIFQFCLKIRKKCKLKWSENSQNSILASFRVPITLKSWPKHIKGV